VRKTYQLNIEGRHRDRVLDAIRHDISKYLKRQRRAALPPGANFWDFDCRFGLSKDSATAAELARLKDLIAAAAQEEASALYVEILPRPGVRQSRTTAPASDEPLQP